MPSLCLCLPVYKWGTSFCCYRDAVQRSIAKPPGPSPMSSYCRCVQSQSVGPWAALVTLAGLLKRLGFGGSRLALAEGVGMAHFFSWLAWVCSRSDGRGAPVGRQDHVRPPEAQAQDWRHVRSAFCWPKQAMGLVQIDRLGKQSLCF